MGICLAVGQFWGTQGLVIAFFIGSFGVIVSYFFSDKIALYSVGAQEVSREEMPELYQIVETLTQRANLPMPRLYVAPQPAPNAFATGRNPRHAAVCVTQGLM